MESSNFLQLNGRWPQLYEHAGFAERYAYSDPHTATIKLRCFAEITLPTIWPSLFGAFLISFILAFNNLEITFYNLGAIPTLPSVAWGSLRFGLGPELFALAALVNLFVFAIFVVMYGLMRTGLVKFGYRGQ